MQSEFPLITTIAASFALALVLGVVANKLKLPTLVGYLLAGVMVGPATPGLVVDLALSQQLAEIGIILLMFGVGLHFSLDNLLEVKRIALPGALACIALSTSLGFVAATLWGWSTGSAVVFGLCISVASTVVLMRAFEQRNLLKSLNGYIGIGWLIVEDLAMVLVLVLLPPLSGWLGGPVADGAGAESLWKVLLFTLLKVAAFMALMHVVGRRVFPWLLAFVANTGSRELFTLSVVAVAVGIAFSAYQMFGVSVALGAFFAGMVMRESPLSHRAANETLPLRDAFSVLFFVSVGMLFDPVILVEQPLQVLTVVAIIVLGKPVVAALMVVMFRYPLNTALTVAAGLSQIGEFSFIVAALGEDLGLLPPEAMNLILAGAFITVSLNTFVFRAIEPAQRWLRTQRPLVRLLEKPGDPLAELPMSIRSDEVTDHVLLVGYGRVGGRIGRGLLQRNIPFVVAEQNREIVEGLRAKGIKAVAGDAAEPGVLIQGHVARARAMLITLPDTLQVRRMVETARMLNPQVVILIRVPTDEEALLLTNENAGTVFLGEQEVARSMLAKVLESF